MRIATEQVLQQGLQQGRTQGLQDEKKATIEAMLKDGASDELIMKYARCTKEQIEEVRSCTE